MCFPSKNLRRKKNIQPSSTDRKETHYNIPMHFEVNGNTRVAESTGKVNSLGKYVAQVLKALLLKAQWRWIVKITG